MTISASFPYTLQNGTTADATQVMADFLQLQSDVNANAAHNGANSDITSMSALTSIIASLLTLTGALTVTGNELVGGTLGVTSDTTLTGKVGIGTAPTTSKFTLRQNQNTLSYADWYNSDTGSSAGFIHRLITSNASGLGTALLQLIKYKTGAAILQNTETDAAAFMAFLVNTFEGLRINSSGYVGVNNSNPTVPLDVGGQINGSAVSISGNDIYEYLTNGLQQLAINGVGYAGGTTQFRDLGIYDGKSALVAYFQGSTKTLFVGGSTRNGATSEVAAKNTPKAWVCFDGTTGTVIKSFNVTSVTHVGTGSWTVNLSITLADANTAVEVSGADDGATAIIYNVATRTTTAVTVNAKNLSNIAKDTAFVTVTIYD